MARLADFDLHQPSLAIALGLLVTLFLLSRTVFWFTSGAIGGIAAILYLHPYSANFQRFKHEPLKHEQFPSSDAAESHRTPSMMSPVLQVAIADAVKGVIKNYVEWWYCPPAFDSDKEFPAACSKALLELLHSTHASLIKKDCVFIFDVVFSKSVATIGAVLSDVRHLQQEGYDVRQPQDYAAAAPDSLIAQFFDLEHKRRMLEVTANSFLKKYLTEEEARCNPLMLFLRKVLALQVLSPVITRLADKDYINAIIIDQLSPQTCQVDHPVQESIAAAAEQLEETITEEFGHSFSDEVIEEAPEASTISRPPLTPVRGRRLSFKERLSGVESPDASRTPCNAEDSDLKHKRKNSLLAKTTSFLSKSRSRSTSPVKSPTLRPTLGSRSASALDLYLAELAVYDASDHAGPIDMHCSARIDPAPQLTILISPTKIPGSTSAGKGICIIKSLPELEVLDQQLRATFSSGPLDVFPPWRSMTYEDIEKQMLAYLSTIVQSEALARADAFVRFCRQDLDFDSRMKALGACIEQVNPTNEMTALDGDELARPKSPFKPLSPFRRNSTLITASGERPRSLRTHSRTNSRSLSPVKGKMAEPVKNRSSTSSWRNRSSALDVQALVDQSMALLGAFFALSTRTWTIRRQLLNLLRGLLLSPSSSYAQAIVKHVEDALDTWVDGDAMAKQIQAYTDTLFSSDPPAVSLTATESRARAEAARSLLLRHGVPQAIKSLMGATPTNEATLILFEAMQQQTLMEGLLCMTLCDALAIIMNA